MALLSPLPLPLLLHSFYCLVAVNVVVNVVFQLQFDQEMMKAVKKAVEEDGEDVNQRDVDDVTPICRAVSRRQKEVSLVEIGRRSRMVVILCLALNIMCCAPVLPVSVAVLGAVAGGGGIPRAVHLPHQQRRGRRVEGRLLDAACTLRRDGWAR